MLSSRGRWMIYGAYGYTGRLIVDEAERLGESPILAGRDRERLENEGRRTGFEVRAFSLDEEFDAALRDVDIVLHCAGPFSRTSRPMVDACLRTTTSYLDITGEIEVFEAIMHRGAEARNAGITLLPGVGFDVVPTDCLAARLAAEAPGATRLDLAFSNRHGGLSPGTSKTMVEGLGRGGAVRRDGKIVEVPVAWDVREIPFESGPLTAMTIPWGDVSTAYYTTGIPNIRVYIAVHPRTVRRLRRTRFLLPLAGFPPLRRLLMKMAGRRKGPDAAQRQRAFMEVWGEVTSPEGVRKSGTMRIPEGYSFTAASAVMAVQRVRGGATEAGAWTPARAFGSGFVDDVLASMGG